VGRKGGWGGSGGGETGGGVRLQRSSRASAEPPERCERITRRPSEATSRAMESKNVEPDPLTGTGRHRRGPSARQPGSELGPRSQGHITVLPETPHARARRNPALAVRPPVPVGCAGTPALDSLEILIVARRPRRLDGGGLTVATISGAAIDRPTHYLRHAAAVRTSYTAIVHDSSSANLIESRAHNSSTARPTPYHRPCSAHGVVQRDERVPAAGAARVMVGAVPTGHRHILRWAEPDRYV